MRPGSQRAAPSPKPVRVLCKGRRSCLHGTRETCEAQAVLSQETWGQASGYHRALQKACPPFLCGTPIQSSHRCLWRIYVVPEMRSFESLMKLVHRIANDGAGGSRKEGAFNRVLRGVSEREGHASQGPGAGKRQPCKGNSARKVRGVGLAEEWGGHCDQAAETSRRGGVGGSERGRLGRSHKVLYAWRGLGFRMQCRPLEGCEQENVMLCFAFSQCPSWCWVEHGPRRKEWTWEDH